MLQLGMVTCDSTRPRELAAWWAERLGGRIVLDSDGYFCIVEAPGSPVALGFQLVETPTPGKNRLHLDFGFPSADLTGIVAEFVAAGATHLGTRGESGFRWDTLTDIDGNEFCLSSAAEHDTDAAENDTDAAEHDTTDA